MSQDGIGNLVIIARQESFMGNQYTSGRLRSQGLFEQRYGLFEARIKLPVGQGIWPAFWMLGNDCTGETICDEGETLWPEVGEIDIMEYRGQDPNAIAASIHGPGYSGASPITSTFRLPDEGSFADEFHVFRVEWDPGRIAFSVDDEVFNIITTPEVTPRGEWVFDHPFFMLLNLAVGGGYVGDPDETTVFPARMEIDYVRVYERAE